jgi:hypothetical protein
VAFAVLGTGQTEDVGIPSIFGTSFTHKQFMFRFLPLTILCTLLLAACASEKTPEPTGNTDTCLTQGQIVSYSADIVPIMETYCSDGSYGQCHQTVNDGGIGFDFTTYDGVAASAPQFEARVLGPAADMPRFDTNGPTDLTVCEKEYLQAWLDLGFPNN